jgi:hypothetical protein
MRGEIRRTSVRRPMALGLAGLMAVSLFSCSGEDRDESAGTTTTTEARSASPTTSSGDRESTSTTSTTVEQATSTTIASAESCRETGGWTTGPETVDVAIADPIYLFEAGRHDAPQCYDQLTIRLNGPADVGYYATYAESNVMRMEGDQSFTVAGDAALVVDIGAPVQGGPFDTSGHAPLLVFARTIGETLYPTSNPRGLKVIREVRFGGEYEAYGQASSLSSFVIGVDRQRPFAVSSFMDEISNARVVVVRVAHRPA